jgi:hypothetical protein
MDNLDEKAKPATLFAGLAIYNSKLPLLLFTFFIRKCFVSIENDQNRAFAFIWQFFAFIYLLIFPGQHNRSKKIFHPTFTRQH